jgi:N-acetylmuramoyl-L-alanine amidase
MMIVFLASRTRLFICAMVLWSGGGLCQPPAMPSPRIDWELGTDKAVFNLRFDHPVTVRATNDLIERQCFYLDFYGEEGPADGADWTIPSPLVKKVVRLHYPAQKVLRFVFFTPFHKDVHFVMSTRGDRARVVTITHIAPQALSGTASKGTGPRRLVVIDPGHGGEDGHGSFSEGAQTSRPIGGRHWSEKDIVLNIALKLAEFIRSSSNLDCLLTRNSDQFVSLDQRIEMANKAQGDLFLSIHLNATNRRRKTARGFEIYYISDEDKTTNHELAALENREEGGGNHNLTHRDEEIRREILRRLADEKFPQIQAQSRQLCMVIDQEFLDSGPFRRYHRGVKSAAFRVLLNLSMPSALAECGFRDNPAEAAQLVQPAVQKKIAALFFNGINRYFAQMDPQFEPHLVQVDP